METVWTGLENQRIYFENPNYHEIGTVKRSWIDPTGVAWAIIDDCRRLLNETADGPEFPDDGGSTGSGKRVPSNAMFEVQPVALRWPNWRE